MQQQYEIPNGVEVGSEGKDCENNSAKSCVVYNPSMPIPYCSCTKEKQPCYRWEMEVGSQLAVLQ